MFTAEFWFSLFHQIFDELQTSISTNSWIYLLGFGTFFIRLFLGLNPKNIWTVKNLRGFEKRYRKINRSKYLKSVRKKFNRFRFVSNFYADEFIYALVSIIFGFIIAEAFELNIGTQKLFVVISGLFGSTIVRKLFKYEDKITDRILDKGTDRLIDSIGTESVPEENLEGNLETIDNESKI